MNISCGAAGGVISSARPRGVQPQPETESQPGKHTGLQYLGLCSLCETDLSGAGGGLSALCLSS